MLAEIYHISPVGHTYSHLKTRHHPLNWKRCFTDYTMTIPWLYHYTCVYFVLFLFSTKLNKWYVGCIPGYDTVESQAQGTGVPKLYTWESTSPVAQNPTTIGDFLSPRPTKLPTRLPTTFDHLCGRGSTGLVDYTAWSRRKVMLSCYDVLDSWFHLKMGFHLKRKNLPLQILGTIFYWIIKQRPRRYHFLKCVHGIFSSSEYTKFACIPSVIPSLRILVENSPKVFASLRRIPTRSLPSKWKIHGLQRVTKRKKSASQTIPRNPSASFSTKHPFRVASKYLQNLGFRKNGGTKTSPRRSTLAKASKSSWSRWPWSCCKLVHLFSWFFWWDEWLKHNKTTLMIKKRNGECSSDESDKRVQVCVCVCFYCILAVLSWISDQTVRCLCWFDIPDDYMTKKWYKTYT